MKNIDMTDLKAYMENMLEIFQKKSGQSWLFAGPPNLVAPFSGCPGRPDTRFVKP